MHHPRRKKKAAAKPGGQKGAAKKKRRVLPRRKKKPAGKGHGHHQGHAPAPRGKKAQKGKTLHPKPRTVAA